MLDCQVALLENALARYFVSGEVPGPLGSRHPAITPFQFFHASDGYVVIAAGNDGLWRKLCEALEIIELIDDARFANNALRTENQAALEPLLEQALGRRAVAEWVEVLGAAGIPCGPIHTIAQVADDVQVAAREMIIELVHPQAGSQAMPNSPLKFSETPVRLEKAAPLLGQDTEEVLRSLVGLNEGDVEDLRRAEVI